MAFVPMTPPPMMPDDIEDLDEIEDFGQIEDEDEDSSSYDLTGMSEKLQSIPKETIQVAPKEVALPPVPSGPDQNGFLTELRGEQIPPDGKSDHENDEFHIPKPEITIEKPPKIEFDTNFSPETPVETNNDDNNLPKLSSPSPEIVKPNSDQDSDFGDFESERNPNFEGFESERNWQDNSDYGDKEEMKIEQESAFDNVIQDIPKTEMETTIQEETRDHEIESKIQDESFRNEPKEEESIQVPDEHSIDSDIEDKPEVPTLQAPPADEDFNADFDADFNDDFGDFKEAFEQDNDGSGEPIAVVPPLNLDEDMDDDDDFGDFEEPEAFTEHQASADKFEAFASSSGWASLDSSPRGQIDQILIGLQLKLATVISNLYVRSLESPDDASLDRVQSLDFAKEECEDAIWIQVHSVSNTPALNQKWKETVTRHRLLDYLKVDPNNVIHQDGGMGRRGGRNTSARPLPQASAYNVPAFASGLGMTLEPIKAAVAASSSTSTAVASTAAAASPADGHGVGPAATTPNATATLEKDNTEESVAMSTTSKSNAFKASRREDNDNHAAVANIKGSSTNPMPAVSIFQNNDISGNGNNTLPSLLPNEEDYRGKSTKTASKHETRSQRAQTVLDSFPLLDFMQSPVLSGSLQAASANL